MSTPTPRALKQKAMVGARAISHPARPMMVRGLKARAASGAPRHSAWTARSDPHKGHCQPVSAWNGHDGNHHVVAGSKAASAAANAPSRIAPSSGGRRPGLGRMPWPSSYADWRATIRGLLTPASTRFMMRTAFAALVMVVTASLSLNAQKPRERDLKLPIGGTPGPLDAITDVAGVEVGQTTLISGSGKLVVGAGPVRTG